MWEVWDRGSDLCQIQRVKCIFALCTESGHKLKTSLQLNFPESGKCSHNSYLQENNLSVPLSVADPGFLRGGSQLQPIIQPNFHKNYMKMKKIEPKEAGIQNFTMRICHYICFSSKCYYLYVPQFRILKKFKDFMRYPTQDFNVFKVTLRTPYIVLLF